MLLARTEASLSDDVLVGCWRSTAPVRVTATGRNDDPLLRQRLRELAAERKRFGYRRLHALLRREKHGDGTSRWPVNHKRVYRLYREEGLAMRRRVRVATDCGRWLAGSRIPKLFINAESGAIFTGRQREFCRTWANQTEVTVEGINFIQEDSPEKIGEALAAFVRSLRSI